MEKLPRMGMSRAEVMKRVARFKDLKGSDGGLPDSHMPGCERTLFNVMGFQPPTGEGEAVTSPVGQDAARLAAIQISEGFNLGYCKARPGSSRTSRPAISASSSVGNVAGFGNPPVIPSVPGGGPARMIASSGSAPARARSENFSAQSTPRF